MERLSKPHWYRKPKDDKSEKGGSVCGDSLQYSYEANNSETFADRRNVRVMLLNNLQTSRDRPKFIKNKYLIQMHRSGGQAQVQEKPVESK